jgi:2'-hydroxyisoflavone reductase
MRLLILGGTQFLGRAIAARACALGHEVICAARGVTGPVPPGARLVRVDRESSDGLAPLVVDVARHPGQVRRAVAALRQRAAHWTFVSTVSVYADNRTPHQHADTAPLKEPTAPDVEHSTEPTYGNAKVACEQAVGDGAFICRAGLIVGPEDPTGRFTYWPARLVRGGEVLAPGSPEDPAQFIDVRDLAQWIVQMAQQRMTGTYDAIGPSLTFGAMLAACAEAAGVSCTLTWVDRVFLEQQGVKRWAGARSLPLWLPLPDLGGFMTRDTTPARDAGLTMRPLAETARDTLAWWRAASGIVTGLTADEERDVLAAWHARG